MNQRNEFVALQYLISTTKEVESLLCQMHIEQKKRIEALNFSEDFLSDYEFGLCIGALHYQLIALVRNMFDKKALSFKTVKQFQDERTKGAINRIHGSRVICRIIKTQNTFGAHMQKETEDIIGVDEICDSNLSALLKELESIWEEIWLAKR